MLNLDEYKVAISKLNPTQLKQAIGTVNKKLLQLSDFENQNQLDKWIDQNRKKACKSSSTYLPLYSTSAKYSNSIKGKANRTNAIDFLMFFYSQSKVYLKCVLHEGNYEVEQTLDGAFTARAFGEEPDGVIYDVFYWRTTRPDIGIAKLRFRNDDWSAVDLVYHYLTKGEGKERAYLRGTTHRNGSTLYVELVDILPKDSPKQIEPIRVFMSLHVPENSGKRTYLSGVFATSNRDSKEPVCGRVILHLAEENSSLDRSDYINYTTEGIEFALHSVPANIYYAVSNERIKGSNRPILSENSIPYANEIKALAKFVGSYQLYQPSVGPELRLMHLTINPNGTIVLTNRNAQNPDVGFVSFCDNVLLIRMKFDPDHAYYRYSLYLERSPDSRDLTGVYAGFTSEGDIVSTRLYLNWVDESASYETLPNEQSYLSLDRLARTAPEAVRYLSNRFLRTTDAFWVSYLTDLERGRQMHQLHPLPDHHLSGTYNAFFMTKVELDPLQGNIDNTSQLPEQPIQLIRIPLTVTGNQVSLVYGTRQISGSIYSNGLNSLTILVDDGAFSSSIMLSMPLPGSHPRTHKSRTVPEYHYGILSRIHKEEPEASALVLHRECDEEHLVFGKFEQISELLRIETRYKGLVSFLFGDWARFVKMPGHAKTTVTFEPKYAAFRRTFFAAACYHGSRDEPDLCLDNLKRAFRHGFGMYQFADLNVNQPGFPTDLLAERQWLQESLTASLSNERIKQYVQERWQLDQFPVSQP